MFKIDDIINKIIQGDCLEVLKKIPSESVNCVVTSPPFWSLRDYTVPPSIWGGDETCPQHIWSDKTTTLKYKSGETNPGLESWYKDKGASDDKGNQFCLKCGAWRGCLGQEPTFQLFLDNLILIFKEIYRVLRKDGTLWVEIGDTYASSGGASRHFGYQDPKYKNGQAGDFVESSLYPQSVKPKSLCNIPHRFAIKMTDELGFILRNSIIWYKENCMPSSATDRFTVDYSTVFFFTKSGKYYFEQQFEPVKQCSIERLNRAISDKNKWVNGADGQTPHNLSQPRPNKTKSYGNNQLSAQVRDNHDIHSSGNHLNRNPRTTWFIPTSPFKDSHFAVMSTEVVKKCILSGCPEAICSVCGKSREKVMKVTGQGKVPPIGGVKKAGGDNPTYSGNNTKLIKEFNGYTDCGCLNKTYTAGIVLDMFAGTGTSCFIAKSLGRDYIGIELNPDYLKMRDHLLAQEVMKFI